MACGGRDQGRTQDTVDRITAAGGTAVAGRRRRVRARGRRRRWSQAAAAALGGLDARRQQRRHRRHRVEAGRRLAGRGVRSHHRTNLRGPFLVAKYAIPHLFEAGGGAIVHMSSVCAITVWAGDCGYDISKAGLNMLSDHIAVEYGPKGIRSNTLMPGVIAHRAARVGDGGDGRRPGLRARAARRHPIGRFGDVGEVADACVFLCADEAGFHDRRQHLDRWRLQPGLSGRAHHRHPHARPARPGLRRRRDQLGPGHDRRRDRHRRGRHRRSARPT